MKDEIFCVFREINTGVFSRDNKPMGCNVLGGELPTNRLGGLVHPSYLRGRLAPTYPIYNRGWFTHLRFVGWTTK